MTKVEVFCQILVRNCKLKVREKLEVVSELKFEVTKACPGVIRSALMTTVKQGLLRGVGHLSL